MPDESSASGPSKKSSNDSKLVKNSDKLKVRKAEALLLVKGLRNISREASDEICQMINDLPSFDDQTASSTLVRQLKNNIRDASRGNEDDLEDMNWDKTFQTVKVLIQLWAMMTPDARKKGIPNAIVNYTTGEKKEDGISYDWWRHICKDHFRTWMETGLCKDKCFSGLTRDPSFDPDKGQTPEDSKPATEKKDNRKRSPSPSTPPRPKRRSKFEENINWTSAPLDDPVSETKSLPESSDDDDNSDSNDGDPGTTQIQKRLIEQEKKIKDYEQQFRELQKQLDSSKDKEANFRKLYTKTAEAARAWKKQFQDLSTKTMEWTERLNGAGKKMTAKLDSMSAELDVISSVKEELKVNKFHLDKTMSEMPKIPRPGEGGKAPRSEPSNGSV